MAFAKIDVCIICEGIRPELNNKTILFGYYGIAPHTRVRMLNPQVNATLCFIFSGGPPTPGKYNMRLRLIDPTGIEVTNPKTSAPILDHVFGEAGGTNVFLSFQGLLGTAGTYRVGLIVNEVEEFSTTFGIDHGSKSIAPIR